MPEAVCASKCRVPVKCVLCSTGMGFKCYQIVTEVMVFCSAICDPGLVKFIFMDVTDFYRPNLIWKHSQTGLNFILVCSLFLTINLMGKVRDLFLNDLLFRGAWSVIQCRQ